MNSKHNCLIFMMLGACYNMLAYVEYMNERYSSHDTYREKAEDYFNRGYDDFMKYDYFHFLKRNLLYAYNKHKKVYNSGFNNSERFENYTFDIPLLKGMNLFNS